MESEIGCPEEKEPELLATPSLALLSFYHHHHDHHPHGGSICVRLYAQIFTGRNSLVIPVTPLPGVHTSL